MASPEASIAQSYISRHAHNPEHDRVGHDRLTSTELVDRHVAPALEDLSDVPAGFAVAGDADLRCALHVDFLKDKLPPDYRRWLRWLLTAS
jgi:hypothetical protein